MGADVDRPTDWRITKLWNDIAPPVRNDDA
jgi:hypothetical protein